MENKTALTVWAGNDKHATKVAVYDDWQRRSPFATKKETAKELSIKYGISVQTVFRYIEEIRRYGYAPRVRTRTQGRKAYAWSAEAVAYLQSFYLAARRDVGYCTRRNAYRRTVKKAQEMGWRVGSEQSAYLYLREVNTALTLYVQGGRRALDNMFYIMRDLSKLDPFQIIVGDQHRFDFWCLDEDGTLFRPECYLWLDMRTRLVYGVAFDRHYNTGTVLRALRMGVQLFGKFGSTYNDNGSAESSSWADIVIEQLQLYGMRFGADNADLYKLQDGRYVCEDADGNVLEYAQSREDWHRTNRRIFANVKNAKTKPIERFFSTLEKLLLDRCLPGYVKELGMSAPEEEEASRRLEWQKKSGYILTYQDFIREAAKAIDEYQNRIHSSLAGSPIDELKKAVENGFRPIFLNDADLRYLFLNQVTAKVQGDRIRLNNRWYQGPALTQEMVLQNRGSLVGLDGKKIQVRFDPEDPDAEVFAIDPRDQRPIILSVIEKIDMLDDAAAARQLEHKYSQVKAITSAYTFLTKNSQVLNDSTVAKPYIEAQEAAETKQLPEKKDYSAEIADRIVEEVQIKAKYQKVYVTDRDRYYDILDQFCAHKKISAKDLDFRAAYEEKMDDSERLYAEQYVKNNMKKGEEANE